MRSARLALWAVAALIPAVAAVAAGPLVVNQSRRAFSVRELHVKRGDAVRFANIDEFLHQIYIDSPQFKFSSPEQAPGQTVDINFTAAGTFEVKCEIHPKMAMTVIVE